MVGPIVTIKHHKVPILKDVLIIILINIVEPKIIAII